MEQNNIEEIKKKAQTFESQYTKLKQEFKDYIEISRKNEEKKKQEMRADFAKKLLAVADSLNRISESYDNVSCDLVKNYSENIKRNIDAIYSQLLSASGLTTIEPASGDKFDEQKHIAVGLEYDTPYPENSVFRVIRKGYIIDNNVVRPSEVIVAKRPAEVKAVKAEFKLSLWERFLRRINPAKFWFMELNKKVDSLKNAMDVKDQKIGELERTQKERVEKLTQDISSLKNIITALETKDQKRNEFERIQKEKVEKLTQETTFLRNIILTMEGKDQKINELERIQKEKLDKLAQEISSLKNTIAELGTKNKNEPEQNEPEQKVDTESNKNYSNINEAEHAG